MEPNLIVPAGVFEFYHTKLESIFKYSELTTNVFQTIREIGNFVLFTMLIEQVMVSVLIEQVFRLSTFQRLIKANGYRENIFSNKWYSTELLNFNNF